MIVPLCLLVEMLLSLGQLLCNPLTSDLSARHSKTRAAKMAKMLRNATARTWTESKSRWGDRRIQVRTAITRSGRQPRGADVGYLPALCTSCPGSLWHIPEPHLWHKTSSFTRAPSFHTLLSAICKHCACTNNQDVQIWRNLCRAALCGPKSRRTCPHPTLPTGTHLCKS